jgi:hypothetical protein
MLLEGAFAQVLSLHVVSKMQVFPAASLTQAFSNEPTAEHVVLTTHPPPVLVIHPAK